MKTQRAIWRRRLIRLTLCLLLGAVMTVGVAWGVAFRGRPQLGSWPVRWSASATGGEQSWWISVSESRCRSEVEVLFQCVPADTPRTHSAHLPLRASKAAERTAAMLPISDFHRTPLARLANAHWAGFPEPIEPRASDGLPAASVSSTAVGWPCRCLMYTQPWAGTVSGNRTITAASSPRDSGYVWWMNRFIPVQPIATGLLLNAVFYAALWWALLVTLGLVKRRLVERRRKRRGACLACGYDLRGLGGGAMCPECGQAARGAARRRPVLSGDC